MKRRLFLATVAAATVAPIVAMASDYVTYTDGVIETALAEGKTVFVDYSASWCSTCHRQERVINALRAQDPAYDVAMTFVKVDWDDYGDHEVAVFRNVPRRSTLLVLRGDAELGRVVAGTSQAQIKELMDTGL
jgi:thioredoxin 1